jgi:hypothetical protein
MFRIFFSYSSLKRSKGFPVQTVKAYRRDGTRAPITFNLGARWEWLMVNAAATLPTGRNPDVHLTDGWVGTKASLGVWEQRKRLISDGFGTPSSSSPYPSHCTSHAIPVVYSSRKRGRCVTFFRYAVVIGRRDVASGYVAFFGVRGYNLNESVLCFCQSYFCKSSRIFYVMQYLFVKIFLYHPQALGLSSRVNWKLHSLNLDYRSSAHKEKLWSN